MTASCTSVVNLANVTPIACPNSFDLWSTTCNTKQDQFHFLSNILSNGHKQVSETKNRFVKCLKIFTVFLEKEEKTLLDFMKLNGTALKISFDVFVDFVFQCHVPELVKTQKLNLA